MDIIIIIINLIFKISDYNIFTISYKFLAYTNNNNNNNNRNDIYYNLNIKIYIDLIIYIILFFI